MDLQTINDFIEGLEAEEPNLKNCAQLASLYIVKKHLENIQANDVEKEIRDILPSYRIYADVKAKYQKHELTEEAVISALHNLCTEIGELMKILYASTEMAKERREIGRLIGELADLYSKA